MASAAAHPTLAAALLSQLQGCSLCSPPRLGAAGRGKGEKSRGRSSQRRMFPVLGVFLMSSHRWKWLGVPAVILALLVQPLPARLPSRREHLSRDQPPDPCGLSILYCFAWKSQTYGRESRTESSKSQELLASLQPRNRLFIANACWQRDDPVRQGMF